MKLLLDLFFVFAKIGVMTFGGGYAMLPILKREVVEIRNTNYAQKRSNYAQVLFFGKIFDIIYSGYFKEITREIPLLIFP